MPVEHVPRQRAPAGTAGALSSAEPVLFEVVLRPHRSLSVKGFVTVIALAGGFLSLPLIPLLGTMALWMMLPFLLGALALLWYFIRRNAADGTLTERLVLTGAQISVTRQNPRGPTQFWQANPYWTRLALSAGDGPVANYITLKGGGREIELGRFLSPFERKQLFAELQTALAELRPDG